MRKCTTSRSTILILIWKLKLEQLNKRFRQKALAKRPKRRGHGSDGYSATIKGAACAKLGQAADIITEHPVALQLRTLQTMAEISIEKNSTIIFPAQFMTTVQDAVALMKFGFKIDSGNDRDWSRRRIAIGVLARMFEIENFLIVVALALALVTVYVKRHSQFGQRNGGINVAAGMSGSLMPLSTPASPRSPSRRVVPGWLVLCGTSSPNFAQILRKCLKRLNTRKICSHNERNKSLDVASSADSNRSTWTLGRFFSCAAMPKAAPKAECSQCSRANESNSRHLRSARAKFGLVNLPHNVSATCGCCRSTRSAHGPRGRPRRDQPALPCCGVWHPTAKHRPIRVLDGLKLAQDPRLGKLPTLVRPQGRGRMASSPVDTTTRARSSHMAPRGYLGCAVSGGARPCANLGNRQQAAPPPSVSAIPPSGGMMLHCGM